ncbi:DUF924 family protein [Malonomonas rubra]|uniref:DUF924 family protein n=1 Tax=Malonomonas rubra TaxID=57040 RepID=UPI0026EDB517|nr:DUF924 family protein [Malonomonas rubra]
MNKSEKILRYWFGSSEDDLQVMEQKVKLWFGKDEQVDREIGTIFGSWIATAAAEGVLPGDEQVGQRYLATIILLDQFTRNIYRGDARAFTSDSIALRLAMDSLQNNYDSGLRPIERVFIYLPLEHAEEMEMQNRSVALFEELTRNVPKRMRSAFEGFLDYAVRHREIITRFGRFPHRNLILGRESTAEEIEFLKQPNSSF